MFDTIFNMTKIKQKQEELLNIIHGLTKRVIKEKKRLFEKNYKEGNAPTPSLSEIIANDYVIPSKPAKAPAEGLRDDLDDIDENDVGESALQSSEIVHFNVNFQPNKKLCLIIKLSIQVKSDDWHFWI